MCQQHFDQLEKEYLQSDVKWLEAFEIEEINADKSPRGFCNAHGHGVRGYFITCPHCGSEIQWYSSRPRGSDTEFAGRISVLPAKRAFFFKQIFARMIALLTGLCIFLMSCGAATKAAIPIPRPSVPESRIWIPEYGHCSQSEWWKCTPHTTCVETSEGSYRCMRTPNYPTDPCLTFFDCEKEGEICIEGAGLCISKDMYSMKGGLR
jgi:hypothetical protein